MSASPKRFSRTRIIACLLLAATLGGIAAYEFSGRGRQPAALPLPPIVRTVEITASSEFETKSYPGIAKESRIAKLSFRVPGKLVDSSMTIGARIEKGGIIARLDPRDFQLAVERLEAELHAAESLFAAMKTGARPEDVASLESQLAAATSAYTTAETNLNRFTALLADQVAAQSQYDLAKTQFDTAKGQKETLENELEKAKTGARKEDIDAMQAKILGLQAGLNTARNALDDTCLKAPFDGMIVEKFIEDHEVVGPGMPVVSFINVSQIDIAVSLPEEMIVRLDDIRAYRVEFEAYPGQVYPATLKELGRAIQRGRQSYPLQVRVDWPQKETTKKHRPVFPGMTAMVMIDLARTTDRAGVPQTIPLAALLGNDKETAVWLLEHSGIADAPETYRIVRRPVTLLRIVGTRAEIESELKPKDQIVAAGARFLSEGQLVRLESSVDNR